MVPGAVRAGAGFGPSGQAPGEAIPAIEATGLSKVFGRQVALRGISLTLSAGSILGVLGHNGSGKTTLLRLLATLIRPTAGRARVLGHDLVHEREAVRRAIALVGHETHLYDDLTATENLAFTAALAGEPIAPVRTREALALVGLERQADARVRTLSSGMRRRVSLARALLRQARVLLLDEPFSGLDHAAGKRIEDFLLAFKAGGGAGILVTHSLGRALAVADQVLILAGGRVSGRAAGHEVTATVLQGLVQSAAGGELGA